MAWNQAALTELAGLLMATSSFEELMQAVADLAGRAVPAAATCGITLSEDGHVITVASADALARMLDEQQYQVLDGPCLEAIRTARVVLSDDLSIDKRWDGYPAMAVAHGVRAVLSSPLMVGSSPIGPTKMRSSGTSGPSRPAARHTGCREPGPVVRSTGRCRDPSGAVASSR